MYGSVMWESELGFWRAKIARERGGPVKWRLQAIETVDLMLARIDEARREGRLQPGWGVHKN